MQFPKRIIDILLSLIGLIVITPFIPIIGLLIKLDSRGPVFYLADRVGKGMKNFKMYKFRTMIETPIEVGESLSPQYDPRVTPFGRFLRRTKINELPQFLNILRGEMTFVGPRPEAPDLAQLYPEEAKSIFSLKPGLVSPGTILGRNEEEVYPPGVDAKKYYIQNILPNKVKMDLKYCKNGNLFKDFKYIMAGVKETLVGALSKRHIRDNRSQIYLLLSDIFLTACSYLFATAVSLWIWNREISWLYFFLSLPLVILTRVVCNIFFRMYNSLIRYISFYDVLSVLKGVTCGSFFLAIIDSAFGWVNYFGLIMVFDWLCLINLLSGLRFGLKIYWDKTHRKNDERKRHRILIYGVCDEGNAACRALTSEKYMPFEIVGFIDDDPVKYGKIINGKKVLGNRYHIKALVQLYRVEEILIAGRGIHPDRLSEIVGICQELKLNFRIWNSNDDFVSLNGYTLPVKNLDFSDVLSLRKIRSDHAEVRKILTDKTVLVNGTGGALGLELCRKVLLLGCRRLIIIDRYESYLNELVASLVNDFNRESIVPALYDTDGIETLEEVFKNYRPELVFQAAMRKYLPLLGVDLDDVGRTNYLRTFNLAKMAAKYQCENFVMISSLMAGNGGNFITASLRIAEISLEYFLGDTHTRLIIARLPDIAENRGGIVSTLNDQIENQRAVILPSAGAQTCLISKYSAAEFILQAMVEVNKNSADKKIFVCDPGKPIPLIEVTRKLAGLYRLRLGSDLPVKYMGQFEQGFLTSPQEISPFNSTDPRAIRVAEENAGFANGELKSLFKEFVLNGKDKSNPQYWKAQTRELIKLCELEPLSLRSC